VKLSCLRRYGAACGLVLLLAGCAGMKAQTGQNQKAVLERHYNDNIGLAGRLSILYAQNGHEQGVHGSFTWDQHRDHIVLNLLSPLGQTLAVIDIKPGIAVLTQADKSPIAAADVDLLTAQALGWPLPVSGLREWLQGFGHTAEGHAFVAQPNNATSSFETPDGWTLTYGVWQDDADNTPQNRPKRIDLRRQTEQAGPVSIRIVVDKWQVTDTATTQQ